MTLATTPPSIDYVENGVTLVYPIPFQFLLANEIVCTRIANGVATVCVPGADYSVTGGNDLTGTVIKTSAGVAGTVFRVARHTTRAQPAEYAAHDDFPAELTGTALDRLAMVNQEQDASLGDVESRAIRVPPGETTAELPVAAARKGTILGFNLITGFKELLNYQSLSALLAASLTALLPGMIKGDPGGTTMAIGAFAGAAALNIPVGTDLVKTSSYAVNGNGRGAAEYIYDAAVDAAYVIAHPRAAFVTANNRGFRLSPYQQLDLLMFGAVPDWDGIAGTDAYAAFVAAFDYIIANSTPAYINGNIYRAGVPLRVPGGRYFCSAPIEPLVTLTLYGDGGKVWSAGTQIYFPSNVTALRSQGTLTSGETTIDGANHYAGDQLLVRDMAFLAPGYTGVAVVEGDYYGCHAKRPMHLLRCSFEGFQGDGLFVDGTGIGGGANLGRVEFCTFNNNRNGRYATGGDANVWTFLGNNYSFNREWGVKERGFLGNHEKDAHADGNGVIANMASFTLVSYMGNRYSVVDGQEVWAAANAPSGTTANNTGWYFAYAGGAVAGIVPAWVAGLPVRAGGSYSAINLNAANTFLGCYAESGQGNPQFTSPTLILGGTLGKLNGSGCFIHSSLGGCVIENGEANNGLLLKGALTVQIGALSITADPANEFIVIDGANAPQIQAKIGGVLKSQFYTNLAGTFLSTDTGNLYIRNLAGVDQVSMLGQRIFVAGIQVVTTQQAGIANDASGAANAGTVNAILTAMRNHGLIA